MSVGSNQDTWLKEVELLDPAVEPASVSAGAPLEAIVKGLGQSPLQGDLMSNVFQELRKELEIVVPWFLNQMPPLYHFITPLGQKIDTILEIVAGKVLTEEQTVERVDTKDERVTIIAPGQSAKATARIAPRLSKYQGKQLILVGSVDGKMGVCHISQRSYSSEKAWEGAIQKQKRQLITDLLSAHPVQEVNEYLDSLDADFASQATTRLMALGFEAINYCQDQENSYVNLTTVADTENRFRVDVGLKGFPCAAAVENVVNIFARYNMVVRRAFVNEVRSLKGEQFTVMTLVASQEDGTALDQNSAPWQRVFKSLKSLSYVDHGDEFSQLMQGQNPRSLNETNLARAMANWCHIFLSKANPYYYSQDKVSKILCKSDQFLDHAIGYFRNKFDPRIVGDRSAKSNEHSRAIDTLLVEQSDEIEKNVLREGFSFLRNILKTNYFVVSKGALSFRMDPAVLNRNHYPDLPYGIFFMIGRDFRGFQVRYRDIARGGVRVVMPRTSADYDNALAGIFDEVSGLASAQQLKNKDIPEGGSKAVFVVRPGGNRHLAVKSAISGLLDLITLDPKTGKLHPQIVDYLGQEEIVYLGPDENMTDDLILWTIEHALFRQYKYAYAFMSSKPDFGINHKTYGVTSEGLNVYLDNVLSHLRLKGPNSTFRVKMTGGPDGDVAGNELKILHREYGERCRVVAVGDGYGCAYDPNGLEWSELLRLFHESKSIVEFDKGKLSRDPKAFVISADSKENIKVRDNLYATVEAEIFIPAGGRPYTVKENNWHKFLKSDGKPSSLAIVEGANIFFTPEARKKIVESGVVVIKDSSANKAGVICSSFEIIACLTLSPQEFAALKTQYVNEVISILHRKADNEAKLLFRELQKQGSDTNLVDLSYEISKEINFAKDVVREHLNRLSDDELNTEKFNFILYQHCPAILVEKYRDRIVNRLPRAHKIAIMSAYMASHLVYKEGLGWLNELEPSEVFRIALQYIDAEQTVENLVHDVQASQLGDKEKIIAVLKGAGAKHLASAGANAGAGAGAGAK
jgi:glutamate dehydrogenase